ncbi:hypothetical protein [Roseivivax sp. THAF40]|nr:hypothetical protein [Roseivivax sp. THAF40]
MKPAEFRQLVENGHLPRGNEIAGIRRWDVDELRKIFMGDLADGGFQW